MCREPCSGDDRHRRDPGLQAAPGSDPHRRPSMNAVLPLADFLLLVAVLAVAVLVTLAVTRTDERSAI